MLEPRSPERQRAATSASDGACASKNPHVCRRISSDAGLAAEIAPAAASEADGRSQFDRAAGGSSTSAQALVPPKPNEFTAAIRGCAAGSTGDSPGISIPSS